MDPGLLEGCGQLWISMEDCGQPLDLPGVCGHEEWGLVATCNPKEWTVPQATPSTPGAGQAMLEEAQALPALDQDQDTCGTGLGRCLSS
jgi:hypothetical protein